MAAGKITQGFIPNYLEEFVIGNLGRLTRKDLHGVAPMGSGYPMVYVCSPYGANPAHYTALAKGFCKYAIDHNVQPVASHLLYPQFLDDQDDLQREMGLTFGLQMLHLCNEVWVFRPTGGVSPGMKAEIEEAKKAKIPVVYINDPRAYGQGGWDPVREYNREAEEQAKEQAKAAKEAE